MCPPLHWGRVSYLRNRRRISTTRRVCRWIFWATVIPFPFRPLVLPFSLSTLYVFQYMIINRSRPARPVSFPMKDVPLLSRRKRWDYCVSRRSTVPPVVHVHASDADPLLSLPLDESSFLASSAALRRAAIFSRERLPPSCTCQLVRSNLGIPSPSKEHSNIDSLRAVSRRNSASFCEDSRLSPHAPLFSPRGDQFATGCQTRGDGA